MNRVKRKSRITTNWYVGVLATVGKWCRRGSSIVLLNQKSSAFNYGRSH
jgi:hypothetical protein